MKSWCIKKCRTTLSRGFHNVISLGEIIAEDIWLLTKQWGVTWLIKLMSTASELSYWKLSVGRAIWMSNLEMISLTFLKWYSINSIWYFHMKREKSTIMWLHLLLHQSFPQCLVFLLIGLCITWEREDSWARRSQPGVEVLQRRGSENAEFGTTVYKPVSNNKAKNVRSGVYAWR